MSKSKKLNHIVTNLMTITCVFIALFLFFLLQAALKESVSHELSKTFFFISLFCLTLGLITDIIAMFVAIRRDKTERMGQ